MRVTDDSVVSSRLCYNVPIDWPARLRAKLKAVHPGAVVFMIGANDGGASITVKGKRLHSSGARGWVTAFRQIVGGMMDDAIKAGVQRIYWVGMPIMKPGKYPSSDQMKRLNFTYRYEAGVHSVYVRYIDIWGLLATKDGKYDPQWRSTDEQGAHLNHGRRPPHRGQGDGGHQGRLAAGAVGRELLPSLGPAAGHPRSPAGRRLAAPGRSPGARRAAARRRGLARLAVLLAAIVLIVVLVVAFAGGGKGGKGSGTQGTSSPRTSPGISTGPGGGLFTPTTSKPLRLKNYGDSMGGELGMALGPQVNKVSTIKYWTYYKVSSSLVKPDFFDWPKYLRQDLPHRHLHAAIFMVGTNDGQGMKIGNTVLDFGTKAWRTEYRRRVGALLDVFEQAGVKRVYWVGMPIMKSQAFSDVMRVIDQEAKAEVGRHKIARFVDTWKLFSTSAGAFDPQWRQSDGVHFNIAGQNRLATSVLAAVEADWHIQ